MMVITCSTITMKIKWDNKYNVSSIKHGHILETQLMLDPFLYIFFISESILKEL